MLKLVVNGELRTFQNPVDAFDPRLNPLPAASLTTAQYFETLKSFWTRENILAHPKWFFSFQNGYPTWSESEWVDNIRAIIAPIPDEKLWLLNFTCVWQHTARENTFYCVPVKFVDQFFQPGRHWCAYEYGEPGARTRYSYRGDNWESEFLPLVTRNETLFLNFFNQHQNDPVRIENGSYYNSIIWFYLSRYFCDQPFLHSQNGEQNYRHSNLPVLDDAVINWAEDPVTFRTGYPAIKIRITKNNRSALHQVFNYSTSPLSFLDWPLKAPGEHNPVLYGVELELATDYQPKDIIEATDEPFFIIKSDSSVTGDRKYKYELVTVPMSYKAHKKQWAYLFSNLDYDQFDTSKDTNNGMHVHISRDAFADEAHIQNFTWFFTQPAHYEFMRMYSERDNESFNNYTQIRLGNERRPVRAYNRTVDQAKSVRGCINFSNKGTLEVRLFRGIVSLADILKNLEFVDSIFHFTMRDSLFTKLTLKEYMVWLKKQPRNKYIILKKYFSSYTKMKALIETSDFLALIFNEKQPRKILEIIEKKQFPVTNEHVTILNKRFRKRVFILNKLTGKIEIDRSNQSSVSFLDRIMEKKILGKDRTIKPIQPSVIEHEVVYDPPELIGNHEARI